MHSPWNVRAVIAALAMIVMPWLLHAQQAQIRATHLAVGAPDLDVYIASDTASFYGLAYGNASAVSSLLPAGVRVRITEHNIPTPLFYDENITLQANRRVNIMVLGTPGNLVIKSLSLPTNAPVIPQDSAYVRFVNAAPDAASVDIRITDAYGNVTSMPGVTFSSNTMFQSLPKGTADIEVFAAGTQNRLLRVRNDFARSSRSTIFLSGQVSGSEPLKLQLMNELPLSAQQPIRALQAPSVKLRAVHAVPDGPSIDVYTDNTSAVSNLAFRDASQLVTIESGEHTIGVTGAGQPLGSAIINLNLNLSDDSIYTAVALGKLSGPPSALLLARPALMGVSTDSALIRVVQAYTDVASVDVAVQTAGDALSYDALEVGSATAYTRIPAGDITVRMGPSGGNQLHMARGTIEGGAILTILATGIGSDIQINMLDDANTSPQIPMGVLTSVATGALRAVHLIPDGPEADIFINDNADDPLSVGFRDASRVVGLSEGTANVKVAAHGTGIGAALVDRDIQITGDELMTVFAVGSLASFSVDVVTLATTDEDMPAPGETVLRFLHASPDAGAVDIELTVSTGQSQLYPDLTFKSGLSYSFIPSGTASAKVYAAGTQTLLLSVEGEVPAGQTLTAILSGSVAGGNLGANLLIDSDGDAQKPMILFTSVVAAAPADRLGSAVMAIAPNPANGIARVLYTLDRPGRVRLALYDQLGRIVATAEPGAREAGSYSMTFSTALLPAGVYNAVLCDADGASIGVEKLVVVK